MQVHDGFKKDEKITTNFEALDDEDIMNKAYQNKNSLKIVGHLSLLE